MEEIDRCSNETRKNRVDCRPIGGDVIADIRRKMRDARSQPSDADIEFEIVLNPF